MFCSEHHFVDIVCHVCGTFLEVMFVFPVALKAQAQNYAHRGHFNIRTPFNLSYRELFCNIHIDEQCQLNQFTSLYLIQRLIH